MHEPQYGRLSDFLRFLAYAAHILLHCSQHSFLYSSSEGEPPIFENNVLTSMRVQKSDPFTSFNSIVLPSSLHISLKSLSPLDCS
jgi:hypothetical protein